MKLRARLQALPRSQFAVTAFWVLLFNTASNILLLLANTYAARCLGPANLGVSAQVQAAVQQGSLAFNGGFDPVAVRAAAGGEHSPADVARAVLTFRLVAALLLAAAWATVAALVLPTGPVLLAWLLGAVLLVIASVQLPFLFQSVDQLPRHAALAASSSLLVAIAFFAAFRPGMPVGSDLLVLSVIGVIAAVATCFVGFRLVGLSPRSFALAWPQSRMVLRSLLAHSWRYWLLAGLALVYTTVPVLLVGYWQGPAAAGIFRTCLVLAGGLELVFSSINSLLLPRLVRWHHEGTGVMRARQRQVVLVHSLLGTALWLTAAVLAPLVFEQLLGPEFAPGLRPFLVLAFSRVVVFVGQVYAWGLIAMKLDRQLLVATGCGAAASLLLNALLIPRLAVVGAAYVALLAEVVVVSLAWLFSRAATR